MKFIYRLMANYHWHLARWFRKQYRTCGHNHNYWDLRARGHVFNNNERKAKE